MRGDFAATPDPLGLALPARQVTFDGALAAVPPQTILTDFVVDRVFPLIPQSPIPNPQLRVEKVATVRTGGPEGAICVGTRKVYASDGQAVVLGFRPRDDQAASTGVEARTWFAVLRALGVYAGDGNPVVISRATDWLATTFPNGAVALCPHYRRHAESWPGGFFRDAELDAQLMAQNPPPDDAIALDNLRIAGQTVTYRGRHAVIWRISTDSTNETDSKETKSINPFKSGRSVALIAFAGTACTGITLNGHTFTWSAEPVDIAWHPLGPQYATPDGVPLYRVWAGTTGTVRLPLNLERDVEVWLGARGRVGYGERLAAFRLADGDLVLDVDDTLAGRWLYVIRPERSA